MADFEVISNKWVKADIIWCHFGLKKGKSDCYRGGGRCLQTVRRYSYISKRHFL